MTIYEQAADLIRRVREATSVMADGEVPSVLTLGSLQGEVVQLFFDLGREESGMFRGKERAILERKCAAARHHLQGRREFSLTQQDAYQKAIEKTRAEHDAEIEAESTYEELKILRASVDMCFRHLHQVISTVKNMEQKPSPSQS